MAIVIANRTEEGMEMDSKFYVISQDLVGASLRDDPDGNTMIITTDVPRTNASGAVLTRGWLGSTNDVSFEAHGEFETLEAAQAFVDEYTDGDYRVIDDEMVPGMFDDGTVAAYRMGRYEQLDQSDTISTATLGDENCGVTATSSDAEIDEIVVTFEAQLRADTASQINVEALRDYLERRRETLKEEADEEEEAA